MGRYSSVSLPGKQTHCVLHASHLVIVEEQVMFMQVPDIILHPIVTHMPNIYS